MKKYKAFITGLAGLEITEEEKKFIHAHRPWGFVLFSRNVDTAAQVKKLTKSLRMATGRRRLPIFADQEGGRVQRLRPPLAPHYPAAAALGALYRRNSGQGLRAAWLMARLIGLDLRKYGITGDFLPLLDVPVSGSHDVIGDRAYGNDPDMAAVLGRETVKALQASGLLAVMKHIPGHGRAFADTHKEPARADADKMTLQKTDFVPFQKLADIPAAMTAHVLYPAYDSRNPATLSSAVIKELIRNEIGFDGLLMSDDLSMQALPGSIAERTAGSFTAGCDIVLHCNGNMEEMQAVAAHSPYLEGKAAKRARKAAQWIRKPQPVCEKILREEFSALMSAAAV